MLDPGGISGSQHLTIPGTGSRAPPRAKRSTDGPPPAKLRCSPQPPDQPAGPVQQRFLSPLRHIDLSSVLPEAAFSSPPPSPPPCLEHRQQRSPFGHVSSPRHLSPVRRPNHVEACPYEARFARQRLVLAAALERGSRRAVRVAVWQRLARWASCRRAARRRAPHRRVPAAVAALRRSSTIPLLASCWRKLRTAALIRSAEVTRLKARRAGEQWGHRERRRADATLTRAAGSLARRSRIAVLATRFAALWVYSVARRRARGCRPRVEAALMHRACLLRLLHRYWRRLLSVRLRRQRREHRRRAAELTKEVESLRAAASKTAAAARRAEAHQLSAAKRKQLHRGNLLATSCSLRANKALRLRWYLLLLRYALRRRLTRVFVVGQRSSAAAASASRSAEREHLRQRFAALRVFALRVRFRRRRRALRRRTALAASALARVSSDLRRRRAWRLWAGWLYRRRRRRAASIHLRKQTERRLVLHALAGLYDAAVRGDRRHSALSTMSLRAARLCGAGAGLGLLEQRRD
eukprot:TRINITY_DN16392_c0_g1_i1.p1 TRINITY_DN16392_c0_g1~~TRINITY_DN16392_c0_g1_i1.p1  ORF type:complete len:523 (+),score=78.46 TRINITY_DN16392_c0_g1_i1:55-1623(+)